jgi:glutathione S-transferase
MKLYYTPGTCSLADYIVLEWIGKPYDVQHVSREARHQPDYLAINPAGAVPALDDDGWILTQNTAILHYLVDLSPESKLVGDGTPKSRAEVNRWLAFANSDLHPAFKVFWGGLSWLDDEAMVAKGLDHARRNLRTMFERADRQLEGKDWIAGVRSIADPYLFVTLRWAHAAKVDLKGLENLRAFYDRMRRDPGVEKVLKFEGA